MKLRSVIEEKDLVEYDELRLLNTEGDLLVDCFVNDLDTLYIGGYISLLDLGVMSFALDGFRFLIQLDTRRE